MVDLDKAPLTGQALDPVGPADDLSRREELHPVVPHAMHASLELRPRIAVGGETSTGKEVTPAPLAYSISVRKRSASTAAMQPLPAAVTAWR
jgi:hypothetical protein